MSDTREYIIDQAYGLFLTKSYEAVSISEISKAIGFTKGALYHHFTNKEELFKAVIDKYLSVENFFITVEVPSLRQYIDELVKTTGKIVFNIVGDKPGYLPLSYLSLFIDAFRHYSEFAKKKDTLIQGEINKVKVMLVKAIERGEIRKDVNVDYMALNFFSLSIGIAGNLVMNNTPQQSIEMLHNQLNELYRLMKI